MSLIAKLGGSLGIKGLKENICLTTDSYKASHSSQYPPGTSKIYSYLESRGSEGDQYGYTVFFGLQYIIKKYFTKPVTKEDVDRAEIFWNEHFGFKVFDRSKWDYIVDNLGGVLPIRIKAIPEGTKVSLKNVLATIENTDDNCYWLTNFLETIILQVWAPITVATNSSHCKDLILKYLDETGTPEAIAFKLHDFGYRGVSSMETAGILGAAHLTQFMGTDTIAGIILAMEYYDAEMIGFSVPASEHSTMTSWGRDNETGAYRNMLEIYADAPIVSIVSDSYDIFNAVSHIYGEELKDQILSRPGKVVIRPDSGDPVEVNRALIKALWEKFGGSTNEKGYKVLDPHIGLIQGDGIDYEMIGKILEMLKAEGFSADNIVFGSGGGLLQKFNRDTLKFAIKCSYAVINGQEVNVQKDPVTAKGKKSKSGRLKLVKTDSGYITMSSNEPGFEEAHDEMVLVYENGKMYNTQTFDQIRTRS